MRKDPNRFMAPSVVKRHKYNKKTGQQSTTQEQQLPAKFMAVGLEDARFLNHDGASGQCQS